MRRSLAGLAALALLAATPAFSAEAPVEKTFLIPASDGYGVADCLTTGSGECGQVVADAWCESQGFATAASYGLAAQDEYTGAISTAAVSRSAERPIRITCKD